MFATQHCPKVQPRARWRKRRSASSVLIHWRCVSSMRRLPCLMDPEVLIAGAGPTGLVLALWLARLGIRVRIVDKNAEPGTTSRALAVQARTLELYSQVGLADAVVERG